MKRRFLNLKVKVDLPIEILSADALEALDEISLGNDSLARKVLVLLIKDYVYYVIKLDKFSQAIVKTRDDIREMDRENGVNIKNIQEKTKNGNNYYSRK